MNSKERKKGLPKVVLMGTGKEERSEFVTVLPTASTLVNEKDQKLDSTKASLKGKVLDVVLAHKL